MECLHVYYLVAKLKKCVFRQRRVEGLRYIFKYGKMWMADNKIRAIRDWKTVFKILKEIRAFWGLASYYRHFIRTFAEIATLISDLLRKN